MGSQHTRELISTGKTTHEHSNKRPESPTVTLTWHASKYKIQTHKKVQKNHIYKDKTKPFISGTLGDTGVYRQKTEPLVIQDFQSLLISTLVQH